MSVSDTWRNYAVANVCSIPSPILAGFMCKSKFFWGRRGTMIIGALVTMAFFFAYTQVRTEAENFGFTCAISFCLVSLLLFTPVLTYLFFGISGAPALLCSMRAATWNTGAYRNSIASRTQDPLRYAVTTSIWMRLYCPCDLSLVWVAGLKPHCFVAMSTSDVKSVLPTLLCDPSQQSLAVLDGIFIRKRTPRIPREHLY